MQRREIVIPEEKVERIATEARTYSNACQCQGITRTYTAR